MRNERLCWLEHLSCGQKYLIFSFFLPVSFCFLRLLLPILEFFFLDFLDFPFWSNFSSRSEIRTLKEFPFSSNNLQITLIGSSPFESQLRSVLRISTIFLNFIGLDMVLSTRVNSTKTKLKLTFLIKSID